MNQENRSEKEGAMKNVETGVPRWIVLVATAVISAAIGVVVVTNTGLVGGGSVAEADQPGRSDEMRPDHSEVTIASGMRGGASWRLSGWTATGQSGTVAGKSALCLKWRWADKSFGPGCVVDSNEALPPGQHLEEQADATREHVTVLFGRVSESVADLTFEFGGESHPAAIFSAPRPMDVPSNFFVGFVPADAVVTLVATDEDGAVLDTSRWEPLPRVTVEKTGSGSGTVAVYLCDGCPTATDPSIECGDRCWLDVLEGVTIKLEATPDVGSTFAGWEGDCPSAADCSYVVHGDSRPVARFEEVP